MSIEHAAQIMILRPKTVNAMLGGKTPQPIGLGQLDGLAAGYSPARAIRIGFEDDRVQATLS